MSLAKLCKVLANLENGLLPVLPVTAPVCFSLRFFERTASAARCADLPPRAIEDRKEPPRVETPCASKSLVLPPQEQTAQAAALLLQDGSSDEHVDDGEHSAKMLKKCFDEHLPAAKDCKNTNSALFLFKKLLAWMHQKKQALTFLLSCPGS